MGWLQAAEVETGQALYARRMYFMKDFLFNHQFVVRTHTLVVSLKIQCTSSYTAKSLPYSTRTHHRYPDIHPIVVLLNKVQI